MTSSVKITAHLAATKKVRVEIKGTSEPSGILFLQDGESIDLSVYDDREINVKEVEKS